MISKEDAQKLVRQYEASITPTKMKEIRDSIERAARKGCTVLNVPVDSVNNEVIAVLRQVGFAVSVYKGRLIISWE